MELPGSAALVGVPNVEVLGSQVAMPLLMTMGDAKSSKADDVPAGLLAQTLAYARELSLLHTASKAQLATLEHQATHDTLSGLPNRTLLLDRLDRAIQVSGDQTRGAALLVMNLDHFQEINGTLGHQHGDSLLCEVGARLEDEFGEIATVARLGGDEFAVLLDLQGEPAAVAAAQQMQRALQSPFVLAGLALDVRASIGIALYPEHAATGEDLLRRADVALRLAKEAKDRFVVYDTTHDVHTPSRLALAGDLCRALQGQELLLHYQPQFACATGALDGVEALVRWQHPDRGLLPPGEFIPLSERTGLIKSITFWGLSTAARQWHAWKCLGLPIRIAVNLSTRCLHDPGLLRHLDAVIDEWGVPPEMLELEITESAVMTEPARSQEVLTSLRERGVRLSIDDFGTGYASLAYLKDLPVDTVKIDKSFVKPMVSSSKDLAIVRCTIELGHELGLRVVAEGVEDQATWEILIGLGCDAAQGWHLGMPSPASIIPTLDRVLAPSPNPSEASGTV